MQKGRILLALGLAVITAFGWGCARKSGVAEQTSQADDSMQAVVLDGDCSKAKYEFACYLDTAMAKGNPDLCAQAGVEKRMDCIEAYQEISGTPIECNLLSDAAFRVQCLQALGSVTSQGRNPVPASASGTGGVLDAQGLKVDKVQ